jgi:chemotaxis family two-component system sensor kinase Cph1
LARLQTDLTRQQAVLSHDPLPSVLANGKQLALVFHHLIDNALKFQGEVAPEIYIGARSQGREWVFFVRDNGVGIDPEYTAKIFRLFERLDSSPIRPGTGLGLALCQKIIEQHGGRMWVESQPGQGATFYFTLPRHDFMKKITKPNL